MKRIALLCVVFLLLMTGCGKEAQNTETETETTANVATEAFRHTETASDIAVSSKPAALQVPPEDRNQAFLCQFVETEEAYYYLRNVGDVGYLIYFCPRGGDMFRPLCSKPNCRHNDFNCNAYSSGELGYYNGAIYTTEFTPSGVLKAIKINPYGTDHQVVAQVDVLGNSKSCSFSCAFHHGKLFIFCEPDQMSLPGEQKNRLIVLNLEDGSQTEPAEEFFDAGENIPYAMERYYKDKMYGTVFDANNDMLMVEVDAVTGEVRTFPGDWMNGFYVTDTTLYYFVEDASYLNGIMGFKVEQGVIGFREYDLDSGTVKTCGLPAKNIRGAVYDNDYIYATSTDHNHETIVEVNEDQDTTFYILSRDYKLVDQIELTDGLSVQAVTSDRIFFSGFAYDAPISCYVDKSEIGSHALTLHPINTIG